MQRLFISIFLLLSTNYAGAVSSSFKVEGTINGSTCKMSNPTIAVELPVRSRSSLSKVGDTAGKTAFSITAENCPVGTSIYFQNDQKSITPQGRLLNTVETGSDDRAGNVELEILNSNGASINLSAAKGLQNNSAAMVGEIANSATFKFYVQYYATGAATAGKVKSSLTFLVESF
jgi:major type 1 subunit fimbrin (pilin)